MGLREEEEEEAAVSFRATLTDTTGLTTAMGNDSDGDDDDGAETLAVSADFVKNRPSFANRLTLMRGRSPPLLLLLLLLFAAPNALSGRATDTVARSTNPTLTVLAVDAEGHVTTLSGTTAALDDKGATREVTSRTLMMVLLPTRVSSASFDTLALVSTVSSSTGSCVSESPTASPTTPCSSVLAPSEADTSRLVMAATDVNVSVAMALTSLLIKACSADPSKPPPATTSCAPKSVLLLLLLLPPPSARTPSARSPWTSLALSASERSLMILVPCTVEDDGEEELLEFWVVLYADATDCNAEFLQADVLAADHEPGMTATQAARSEPPLQHSRDILPEPPRQGTVTMDPTADTGQTKSLSMRYPQ